MPFSLRALWKIQGSIVFRGVSGRLDKQQFVERAAAEDVGRGGQS